MKPIHPKYLWAGVSSAALWGFIAIPMKYLQTYKYSATDILLGRLCTAIALLLLYLITIKRKNVIRDCYTFYLFPLKTKLTFSLAFILSSFFLLGNWVLYLLTVQKYGVKAGVVSYLTTPIFTALLGFFILKEKSDAYKITGLIIAALSIFIYGYGSYSSLYIVILSALCFASYIICQKFLPKVSRVSIFTAQLIIALACLLPIQELKYHNITLPEHYFFWAISLIIGSLFTVLPIALNLYSLIKVPASTVAILLYITPIISFLVSALYYQEALNLQEMTAYSILCFSVLVFNWHAIYQRLSTNKRSSQS